MLVGVDSLLYLFAVSMALVAIVLSIWQHDTRPASLLNLMASERLYRLPASMFSLVLGVEVALFCWNGHLIEFDAEAGSLVVSALWLQGAEMYHGLDDARRTALLYGPVTFLAYALPLWIDPSLFLARVVSACGLLAAIVLTNGLIAGVGNDKAYHRRLQVWGLALAVPFGAVLYTSRADALLLLCMAYATRSAVKGRATVSGIAVGLAIGLKASALLYALPLLVLLKRRGASIAQIGCGCVAACVVSLLPFALPGVSLGNYVDWLREATRHAIQTDILLPNILWLAAAAVPMLGSIKRMDRTVRVVSLGLLASASLTGFMAGKAGAGAYHLLPYLPLYLWCLAQTNEAKLHPVQMAHSVAILLASPIVLVSLCLNSLFLLPAMGFGKTKTNEAIFEEIRRVQSIYPYSRLSIGYGRLEHRQSNAAVYAALNGGHVFLTDVAMWDMHAAGRSLPAGTLDTLKNCSNELWLIPKGDAPFRTASLYQRSGPANLFEGAEAAFSESYRLVHSLDYFDVYLCVS